MVRQLHPIADAFSSNPGSEVTSRVVRQRPFADTDVPSAVEAIHQEMRVRDPGTPLDREPRRSCPDGTSRPNGHRRRSTNPLSLNPPVISTDVLVMVSGDGQVNFSPFGDVIDFLGATTS